MSYQDLLREIPAGAAARDIHDPATGELVGRAPELGTADLDAAVASAREAQPGWDALGHAKRSEYLLAAAAAIEARAEDLADLLSREQGKPLDGPNARFEVGACQGWLQATAALELEPEVLVDDGTTYAELHHRPYGVVGAIGPWNWPMMISIWQIAPSLRMGNTIVVKPSEYTPLSVIALVDTMNTVLPAGVLHVVPGGREVGAAVSTHSGFDKLMFTGSTATGRRIIEASAANVTPVTMELGGNDAGIVLEDVDLEAVAGDLFWGAFINTGQTCAALKRLYVPASRYDEVCTALVDVAKTQPMGVGREPGTVLGPLQNAAQFAIVDRLVEAAKASGARVLLGGDPDREAPGNFYPTTLVAEVDNDNPLVAEEQFGPALPIVKYETLDEAVAMANGLDVGLGASVWGSDRAAALDVAARLEAGTVWVNKHGEINPLIPFGGAKNSGYGLEFGVAGLKAVSQPKVING